MARSSTRVLAAVFVPRSRGISLGRALLVVAQFCAGLDQPELTDPHQHECLPPVEVEIEIVPSARPSAEVLHVFGWLMNTPYRR